VIKIYFLTQGYSVDNNPHYPQPKKWKKLCEQRSHFIDAL